MELTETANLIERLGLPVVGFLLIGFCFWKVNLFGTSMQCENGPSQYD